MVDLYHSGHISLDFVGSRLWFFDESHELLISPWAVAVQAQAPFGAEFHDETVETLVQDQLLGENDSLIRYCWSNQKFCSTTSCHLVAIHGYPKVFNTLTLWLGRLQTTLGIEPLSPVFDKWLRISRSWSLTAKKTSTSPLIHHWFTTMFFSKRNARNRSLQHRAQAAKVWKMLGVKELHHTPDAVDTPYWSPWNDYQWLSNGHHLVYGK